MKIAVTAANGQLGSAIAQQLIEDIGPDQVIAIARTPSKAEFLGIEVRKGDYNSRADFDAALRGVDAVLLVSGKDAPDKRIPQHRNVIEAAKANGLQRIVYTSIIGDEGGTAFNPIVKSNRQTEEDVRNSGLEWSIGRNSIYSEPDLAYLDNYIKKGKIWNCAGDGLCAYTHRKELAHAYSKMLREAQHHGQTYNLAGEAISQAQLAELFNQVYGTQLFYEAMSVENYTESCKEELGDFLGTVIAGIYHGIRNGASNPPSHFEIAAGRPHKSMLQIMQEHKASA